MLCTISVILNFSVSLREIEANSHCNKFGNRGMSRNACSNKNGENSPKSSNP